MKPFEHNARLFNSVIRSSAENGLFDIPVPYFDLLERMRKTQYHTWQLFEKARQYNTLVRQYNDRIHWPSRYLVAKVHGFREKPFLVDNTWYRDPTSVTIIGVCGPSCSGKSTICRSLKPFFDAQLVQLDRFFKKETSGRYNGYPNWETTDSLMIDRFIECLQDLKRGEPTLVPSKGWTEVFDRIVYPKPMVFVDGFLLFLHEDLNAMFDTKIFIDVHEDSILHRRTQRNGSESWDYTVKCVVPNYLMVRPDLIRKADVVINGEEDVSSVRHQVKRMVEGHSL
jgi:uridine kinase